MTRKDSGTKSVSMALAPVQVPVDSGGEARNSAKKRPQNSKRLSKTMVQME